MGTEAASLFVLGELKGPVSRFSVVLLTLRGSYYKRVVSPDGQPVFPFLGTWVLLDILPYAGEQMHEALP